MTIKKVFAVVENDFEYNDEIYFATDGHHVRGIYVNRRDAEEALKGITLSNINAETDFYMYAYEVDELLPHDVTPEDFCERANKKFGSVCAFAPDTLMDDLNRAVTKLDDEQKLTLVDMLEFSFGKVIETSITE